MAGAMALRVRGRHARRSAYQALPPSFARYWWPQLLMALLLGSGLLTWLWHFSVHHVNWLASLRGEP